MGYIQVIMVVTDVLQYKWKHMLPSQSQMLSIFNNSYSNTAKV